MRNKQILIKNIKADISSLHPVLLLKKIERFYQRVEEDPLCVTSRLEINPRNVTEALSASPPTHITADRGIDSVT